MGQYMNLDDITEGLKKQTPKFDPLQQYEVIKKFVEDRGELNVEDLDKLEVATVFDNLWCREYEDKDCEGCPVQKFEEGWGDCASGRYHGYGCSSSSELHPFYERIDRVWYCITALKDHDEEVRKRDLFNAVNDVIHYLRKTIEETTEKP